MKKIKGLIAIVITLWGMMFSLPLLYGEATFKKSHLYLIAMILVEHPLYCL